MPFRLRTYILSLGMAALVAACTDHSLGPQPGLYTAIPDVNFEKALIEQRIDDVQDGRILTANAQKVIHLDISSKAINSLAGVEAFTALNTLYCSQNNLTSLDVRQNTALLFLYCSNNQIITIDISKNTRLAFFDCAYNKLTSLDVSKNPALSFVASLGNQIPTICVSSLSQVKLGRLKDASTTYSVCP